jgi:hypothetical protein
MVDYDFIRVFYFLVRGYLASNDYTKRMFEVQLEELKRQKENLASYYPTKTQILLISIFNSVITITSDDSDPLQRANAYQALRKVNIFLIKEKNIDFVPESTLYEIQSFIELAKQLYLHGDEECSMFYEDEYLYRIYSKYQSVHFSKTECEILWKNNLRYGCSKFKDIIE